MGSIHTEEQDLLATQASEGAWCFLQNGSSALDSPKFIKAKAVCSWCWWALSPQLSPSHPSPHHQPLSLHMYRATGSTEYRGVWGNTQKPPHCLRSCTPLLTSAWPTAALHISNTQREFQVSVWLFLVWTTCKTTEKKSEYRSENRKEHHEGSNSLLQVVAQCIDKHF